MKTHALSLALAAGLFVSTLGVPAAHAATLCFGFLTGAHDDVIVDGMSCTLDGALVRGNVVVSNGGTLATTRDGAEILGALNVNGGGDVGLDFTNLSGGATLTQSANLSIGDGTTVIGAISLTDSGDVAIAETAMVGSLSLLNSGTITANGTLASIISTGSLGITLDGAAVPGGITMDRATGSLTSCGAAIGGSGIFVTQTIGQVMLDGSKRSCPPTMIDDGSLVVEKGTGTVLVVGADLFDLIVLDQIGDVVVSDTKFLTGASLSDLSISGLNGNVSLTGVTADSDASIGTVTGNVTVDEFVLSGDTAITGTIGTVTMTALAVTGDTRVTGTLGDVTLNGSALVGDAVITLGSGAVTVTKTSFSLEDALITGNAGPVLVDRNCDLNLVISENNMVTITNNNEADATKAKVTCNGDGFGFTNVSVTKNTAGVSIVDNTGELLSCADNVPAPTGANNTFTITDGQCAGF